MTTGGSAVERRAGVSPALSVWRGLRPAEWVKNLFVLAPLVFSGSSDEAAALGNALLAFLAFCALASAGYLVNDIVDLNLDRAHPVKRYRPLPSGELSRQMAAFLAGGLATVGLLAALAASPVVLAAVAGYGGLALAYSILLKRIVIIDVMAIAGLFLQRVLAGGLAIDVTVSEWLIVCTGMLALFLGFTKRRQEASSELHSAQSSRPVLEHYSLPFLDQMVSLVTAATVISYVIYAIDSPLVGGDMLATAPPVVYGIFRYLYLIYHRRDERDAAALLTRDPGMIGAGVAWVSIALAVIYV
jgi:4-hydroxybenzoate polyprenyltransferase